MEIYISYIFLVYGFLLQTASFQNQEYTFTRFNTQDGLPSARINTLAQDRAGHIWIATEAGIVRFNGYSFREFYGDSGYIPAKVNALGADRHGSVWIGTANGLSRYANNRFERFAANGLDGISIQHILVDSLDRIFVSTIHELYVIQADERGGYAVESFDIPNIWSLSPGKNGNVLVGTITHLIEWSAGETQTILSDPEHVEFGIKSAYQEGSGILFGTVEENIFRYDLHTRKITTILPYDDYYHDFQGFITWYGQLWAVYGWGIVNLSLPGRYTISLPDEWDIKFVNDSLTDKEGNLWLGTTEGLILIRNSMFKTIDDPVIKSEIYSIHEASDGNIWLGGNFGHVYRMDPAKKISQLEIPVPFGGEVMSIVQNESGEYWIGSYWQGLLHWDGSEFHRYLFDEDSIYGPDILNLYIDKEQNLWIGTTRGLFLKKNEDSTEPLQSFHPRGISNQCDVYDFAELDGSLWVAGSCGLFRYQGSQITQVYLPGLSQSVQIRSIFADGETLWIGTIGYGLKWYKWEEGGLTLLWEINSSGTSILDIEGDGQTIWAATPNGLYKIRKRPGEADYQIFNTYDGFFREGFAHLKLKLTNTGQLYIATSRGLKMLEPSSGIRNYPRKIIIDQFIVNDIASDFSSLPAYLPARIQKIEFSYYYPEIPSSGLISYQWRLHEEAAWSSWTKDRKVTLYDPKPGDYQLEIRARKASKILDTASLSFNVNTPWYSRGWFLIGTFLAIAALSYFYVREREKKIRLRQQLEAERSLMIASLESKLLRAQMNPHFLFNILNNLQEMILTGSTELAHLYLTKFSRMMRMILDLSSKEVIKIEKEVDFLSLYMELENLRFDRPCHYEISVDPELLSMEIPVFMLQPLVENAIRHGFSSFNGDKKLSVCIDEFDGFIRIRVIDNGMGLSKTPANNQVLDDSVRALDLLRNRLEMLSQRWGVSAWLDVKENHEQPGVESCLLLPVYPVQ